MDGRYSLSRTLSTAIAQSGLNIVSWRRGAAQTGFGTSTKTCSMPNRPASQSPSARDAERLRRVVAGGDEVDARARARRPSRARAARPSRTRQGPSSAASSSASARRAGDDPDPPHALRARRPGRAARGRSPRARARTAPRAGTPSPGNVPARPIARPRKSPKASWRSQPSALARIALLPTSGCASSGMWYAASARSCLNSGRRRSASTGVRPVGMEVPEQPVVDEQQLRLELDRALDQLALGRDAGDDRAAPPRRRAPAARWARGRRTRPGSSSSSSAATIEVIRADGVMRRHAMFENVGIGHLNARVSCLAFRERGREPRHHRGSAGGISNVGRGT